MTSTYSATITRERIGYTITLHEHHHGWTFDWTPNSWRLTKRAAIRHAHWLIRTATRADQAPTIRIQP